MAIALTEPPLLRRTSKAFVRVGVFKLGWLVTFSDVVGWVYFVAWSVSFYPQIYLNWKRKSGCVIDSHPVAQRRGLSFDFIGLNLTGFLAYSFFNLGMFFSRIVQVRGFPAPFLVGRVLFPGGVQREQQRVSLAARVLLGAVWAGAAVYGVVTLSAGRRLSRSPWLDYLYYFSYCKLIITLTKYMPQAYLNFKRKSTVGWSIGNILLDFTGGSLSFLQMCLIAHNYDDWTSLFGNVVKTGLSSSAWPSTVLFIVQHYVLYRHGGSGRLENEES
ncbi:hypothetical protein HPB48_009546 [Haemaphysalis longicornis]|uniref:Cystinosin n=1 Tax=Haemaphysalis longicornis TaxID=44386 RepID=A0A9J6GDC1_HAELO|nr:hypothetical protein HPB48_009546 [Haemaphysalis longicornis]